jgi:hypothetical protein
LVWRHLGRVEEIQAFLDGLRPYPSEKIGHLARVMTDPDDLVKPFLKRLQQLADVCMLPQPEVRQPGLTVVLDCNVISDQAMPSFFLDPSVRFIVPADVILELARWEKVDQIPLELDAVEVTEVKGRIPQEIDQMFSPVKRKIPSLADKHVATLALELRADAVVSDDRDLWDTGLPLRIEKSFGHRFEVLRSSEFGRWLRSPVKHPS